MHILLLYVKRVVSHLWFYIVSYYIQWVITSWSYSIGNKNKFNLLVLLEGATWALVVTHVARVHDARVLGVDVVLQPCRSVHTTRTFKFTHNGVYWNILTQKYEVCPVYDAISQLPFSRFFFKFFPPHLANAIVSTKCIFLL